MKNIEEFIVKVSEKDIDLLNKKIDLTRWPDEINHRWSHGTDLNFLKELTNYWRNEFNWRDHEKKINDIGSSDIQPSPDLNFISFIQSQTTIMPFH